MNKQLLQQRESLRKEKDGKHTEVLEEFQEISNQLNQQIDQVILEIRQKHDIGVERLASLKESLNLLLKQLSSLVQISIDGQKELILELQNTLKNSNQNLRSSISDSITKTAKSTSFSVLKITLPILLLLFCGIVYQIRLSSGANKMLIHEEFPGLRQSIATLQESNKEMQEMIEKSQKWSVSQHPGMLAVETPEQWIYLVSKNGRVEELRENEDWAWVRVVQVINKE